MFKDLLLQRARNARYTPLPGHRAMCNHNRLGVVTGIEVDSGELLFTGYHVHDPDKNWQSKDPKPPTTP